MKAVWLENRKLSVRDVRLDRPDDEAAVRVLRAGICNTDLELTRGYYPYTGVLGHEFVGVVEEGPGQLPGRRVVGEINASCGSCAACTNGRRNHCAHRTVLGIVNRHGAFAEVVHLPAGNLHVVPESVSTDAATFVEPLAAALRIQQQLDIGPDQRVVVMGDGKLGQLVARTLALTGCDLLVVGKHPSKLERLEGVAATRTSAAFTSTGFDIAVEVTGNAAGFAVARRAVRPGGTLVMKSTYAGRLELDASAVVVDEITLIGSRCGPFAPAIELLANDRVDVEALVDARYPLDEAPAAFEHAVRPGVLKVLLET